MTRAKHCRTARIAACVVVALTLCLSFDHAAAQTAAKPACDPDNGGLTLIDGFCALLAADSLGAVRHLVVMPNGDIFANVAGSRRGGPGGGIALRDTNGDGRIDVRQPLGTPAGNGIFVRGEYLYVSPNDAVLRYRLRPGTLELAGGPDTLVMGLPTGGHTAKTTIVTAEGAMYVNIGSRTNVCDVPNRGGGAGGEPGGQRGRPGPDPCTELEDRAGIWRFDANRLRQTQSDGVRYATGVRNANGMTLRPGTSELYAVVHGRDALFQNWPRVGYTAEDGAEKPSEVFIRVNQGDDHGWPYCYHDRFLNRLVLAPEYGGDSREAGRCASKTQPLVGFPGHWAPNGLVFYDGTQFPARFRGGVFVAFHGSWNRAPLPQDGFNVVFQPMTDGRPAGEFVVFADGFQELQPTGRPVGVAVGPDGSLYVSDDSGGRIWRIVSR